MNLLRYNIADFQKESSFYGELDLLITIKSFDLRAIRNRYLSSRGNKTGKAGSVERRAPAKGGIAAIRLLSGNIDQESILTELFEPRGIHILENKLAVAAENTVHIIHESGEYFSLTSPWFSYIHTVEFSPHKPDTVLISSSGFDLIQEYNYKTNTLTYEWLAWEHGFNKALDPDTKKEIILTRKPEEAASLSKIQKSFYLVSNPEKDHLPTAKRAAFINSVSYHPADPSLLLATFFHEGKVYEIDITSNMVETVLDGLKNPHGGRKTEFGYMATSTSTGEIIIKTKNSEVILDLSELPEKPIELGDMEWIQNTLSKNHLLIAIDSNRTAFVVIDLEQELYDFIPFNPDWAVQDLVSGTLSVEQQRKLSNL